MRLSARNQLAGRVVSIIRGPVSSFVKVDVGGQHVSATITTESVDDLGLREGREVSAIFKASSVVLGVEN